MHTALNWLKVRTEGTIIFFLRVMNEKQIKEERKKINLQVSSMKESVIRGSNHAVCYF